MISVGVPVVPYSKGCRSYCCRGKKTALEIGYPTDGKLLWVVVEEEQTIKEESEFDPHPFMVASSEALAAFGDGTM